jgi:GAF domain-containing protein
LPQRPLGRHGPLRSGRSHHDFGAGQSRRRRFDPDLACLSAAPRAPPYNLCVAIWPRAVIAVAAARMVIGLALFLSGQINRHVPRPLPLEVYALLAATFGILGLILVAANRRDVRAMWLGGVFVLAATQLSTPLLHARATEGFGWLLYVRPDAFLPALLWRFVSAFPSPLAGRPGSAARAVWQTAAVTGLLLALVNLSYLAAPSAGAAHGWREFLTPTAGSGSLYYPLVYGLGASAFPMLLWRAHRARQDDRRRVLLFTGGLVAGSFPLLLQAILEVVPAYYRFVHRPGMEVAVGLVVFGALVIVPFVTAYSVLFDQVVELRIALRAALQYALARYTILAVSMVPFGALALLVVQHRDEPLTALLSGPRPILLGATAVAGFIALTPRRRWLAALDRRFFREQYDARQTLDRLATDALHAADAAELGGRIHDAIDRALHADARLFVADEKQGSFRDPQDGDDAISTAAILINLVAALAEPMDVDPNDDRSPFRRLPADEQRWLLGGRFRLLLALRTADRRPVGLLALTGKRSGLEYSDEDRGLLSAVAASASLALDNLRLRTGPEPSPAAAARECRRCARLSPPDATACACGGPVVESAAPHLLRGVYRLDRRIGAGGMGVVYHARDLNLDRSVAVKTLPRVTPEATARLRAEARAMAAVVHPNLAAIHGIETWRGIPFLIEEFLAGGTLADRLTWNRLSVAETLDLGVTLADVLAQLHEAGVIHRDVKPSNIGFTRAGVAKLLDFGLARLVRAAATVADDTTTRSAAQHDDVPISSEHGLVGTPSYMSPEALMGRRPRPSFDLWSLAVVLYESMTGRRPFDRRTAVPWPSREAAGDLLPPSALLGACCPADIDRYFTTAFSHEEDRRFSDAKAAESELRRLRAAVR